MYNRTPQPNHTRTRPTAEQGSNEDLLHVHNIRTGITLDKHPSTETKVNAYIELYKISFNAHICYKEIIYA